MADLSRDIPPVGARGPSRSIHQGMLDRLREITPFTALWPLELRRSSHGCTLRLLHLPRPGTTLTVMKITGTATRFAVYEVAIGQRVTTPVDPSVEGELTEEEVYTFDEDDSAWFIYKPEVGSTAAHILTVDTIVIGWEREPAADGQRLFEGFKADLSLPNGDNDHQILEWNDTAQVWQVSYVRGHA